MIFPNPFLKPLPTPEDMDDEKNRELVRAFLGQEGLDRYRSLFAGNRKPKQKTTIEELLRRSQVARRLAESMPDLNANLFKRPEAYVQAAVKLYNEQNMPEWAAAVAGARSLIEKISFEKKADIEKEIKEGCIAILMPGRAVQEQTFVKAIQNFKPVWIVNGVRQVVEQTNLEAYLHEFIKSKQARFFDDVPENPYILLTNPTRVIGHGLRVRGQSIVLKKIQNGTADLFATSISGYLALQAWHTNQKFEQNSQTKNITPLDTDSCLRFIDLTTSDEVISTGFHPNGHCLKLHFDDPDVKDPNIGFRVEVRIKL